MTSDAGAGAAAERRAERLVQEFLAARGWIAAGSTMLVDGTGLLLRFEVPGCEGPVRVGLLPPNGEMASLFAQTGGAGQRVFYAYRGRTSADPPPLAPLHAKLDRLTAMLGLPRPFERPLVAISEPPQCRLERALPWAEL